MKRTFFYFCIMKNIDCIVVGGGLASINFIKFLLEGNKSFIVISDDKYTSSQICGALYNPVILKRFTEVWKADEQLALLHDQYAYFGALFGKTYDVALPVLRKFASIEEQNLWFEKSDKATLQPYLDTSIVSSTTYPVINSKAGFGQVKATGRIAVSSLLNDVKNYLLASNQWFNETFDYASLTITNGRFHYKNYSSQHIVFAEGYGMVNNPYFNHLPLTGNKGELLTIRSSQLQVDAVVKSGCFIIPLGNDLYKVGATYNHQDKDQIPSDRAKTELLEKLSSLINCEFELVNHQAAIRPTVKDRRPLIGEHHEIKNMHVLNGLGTRGVMIGPYAAKALYENITMQKAINPEMDISRFM